MNKSQATVLLYLSLGESRPSTIAQKMNLSRQAISHIIKEMVAADLIVVKRDETDGRSKVLAFSPKADVIRQTSKNTLNDLETLLTRGIGSITVAELKRALAADGGDYVKTREELDALLAREMTRT